MENVAANQVISTILKHDRKVTSYKLALVRAINDVVLSFPDLGRSDQAVAIPLRVLAEYWVAYYWPFVNPTSPILQGPRAKRGQNLTQDLDFRPGLTRLRQKWEQLLESPARPADGFFLINELRLPRKRVGYPPALLTTYYEVLKTISGTLEMPIRYAGPAGQEWSIFSPPQRFERLTTTPEAIPGTRPPDKCLVISAGLWQTFREMNLWVEALCIHEWCLFSERVAQDTGAGVDWGNIYRLLTDRPDNRRPLTWERNQIDLLILEGQEFVCPWSEKKIGRGIKYDLDHLLPVAVYPINELWNLVPADPYYNSHLKRDRLPSALKLTRAIPHLTLAYQHYQSSKLLAVALREDVAARFSLKGAGENSEKLAQAAVGFIEQVGNSRNLARFD